MSKLQIALAVASLMLPLGAQSQNSSQTRDLDAALTGGYVRVVDAQVENLHCGDVQQARELEEVLMGLAKTVLNNHASYHRKIAAIQSIRASGIAFWSMGDSSRCNHERLNNANARAYDQLNEISRLAKLHLGTIG